MRPSAARRTRRTFTDTALPGGSSAARVARAPAGRFDRAIPAPPPNYPPPSSPARRAPDRRRCGLARDPSDVREFLSASTLAGGCSCFARADRARLAGGHQRKPQCLHTRSGRTRSVPAGRQRRRASAKLTHSNLSVLPRPRRPPCPRAPLRRTQPSRRHRLRPAAERRTSRPLHAARGPRTPIGPHPACAIRSEGSTPSRPPGQDRRDAPGAEGGTATRRGSAGNHDRRPMRAIATDRLAVPGGELPWTTEVSHKLILASSRLQSSPRGIRCPGCLRRHLRPAVRCRRARALA